MVLKLDARVPLVWRDPFSLQLGVDPSRVILREVTTADERMIHALSAGVSRSGLSMIARSSGATEGDVARLLERITPVLLPDPPADVTPTVSIVGVGRTVDLIATALTEARVAITVSDSPGDEQGDAPGDLGIAVGHYVLDPHLYGFWLRRDLPHLPVIFGDGDATVGPLVEPGTTPCLYCLEHYRRDVDRSWSAIASQLWGRRSAAETPLVSREAAAMATRMVMRRLDRGSPAGAPSAAAASFRIDTQSGDVTRREWMPHPDCGCTTLEVSAAPSRTGSADDSDLPTRVVAFGELA
jgi:bacteriocin biosynthesis cyclodehydratase domain-containing protein